MSIRNKVKDGEGPYRFDGHRLWMPREDFDVLLRAAIEWGDSDHHWKPVFDRFYLRVRHEERTERPNRNDFRKTADQVSFVVRKDEEEFLRDAAESFAHRRFYDLINLIDGRLEERKANSGKGWPPFLSCDLENPAVKMLYRLYGEGDKGTFALALRRVVLNCADDDLVDKYDDLVGSLKVYSDKGWLALFKEFQADVDRGLIDLSRAHVVDDRYCAFDTVGYVYPTVPEGTREYAVTGMVVCDMVDGHTLSRLVMRGIGDDVTPMYDGRSAAVDGVRAHYLYGAFAAVPGYEDDAHRYVKMTEDYLYPCFRLNRQHDESEADFKERFCAEFYRALARLDGSVFSGESSKVERHLFRCFCRDHHNAVLAAVYDAVVFSDPAVGNGLLRGWDGGVPELGNLNRDLVPPAVMRVVSGGGNERKAGKGVRHKGDDGLKF